MRKTKIADTGLLKSLRRLSRPSTLASTAKPPVQKVKRTGALHRAQILSPDQFHDLKDQVQTESENPERDLVGILLSFYCGLRAQEIAYLEWDRHVFDAKGQFRSHMVNGRVNYTLFISGDIGKRGMERTLPIPELLVQALKDLRKLRRSDVYVFHRLDCPPGYGPLTANAVAQWFRRAYKQYGFEGCSSHTGRRSFVTLGARNAHKNGCSLRDVQLMAGHSNLSTTQSYIEPSDQQGDLVNSLYGTAPAKARIAA